METNIFLSELEIYTEKEGSFDKGSLINGQGSSTPQRHEMKISVPGMWFLPRSYRSKSSQRPLKQYKLSPLVLVAHHKQMVLKTQYTLVVGHRGIKLQLTWKLPPCWLVFTVLAGATLVMVLLSSKTFNAMILTCQERRAHWWHDIIRVSD